MSGKNRCHVEAFLDRHEAIDHWDRFSRIYGLPPCEECGHKMEYVAGADGRTGDLSEQDWVRVCRHQFDSRHEWVDGDMHWIWSKWYIET